MAENVLNLRTSHLRRAISVVQKASNYIKNVLFIVSLSLNELKLNATSRGIEDYKNKSENKTKPKTNFSKLKVNEIAKKFSELRDRFSKSKIKEIS